VSLHYIVEYKPNVQNKGWGKQQCYGLNLLNLLGKSSNNAGGDTKLTSSIIALTPSSTGILIITSNCSVSPSLCCRRQRRYVTIASSRRYPRVKDVEPIVSRPTLR